MAAFQSTVRTTQGFPLPGEKVYDGPSRVYPWLLTSTPQDNIVGATAYTVTSGGSDTGPGVAQASAGA